MDVVRIQKGICQNGHAGQNARIPVDQVAGPHEATWVARVGLILDDAACG